MTDESIHHEAALDAVAVLEAMERPEVMSAYVEACNALTHYAGALQNARVPSQQVCSQLFSAVVAVIWRALEIEQ